MEPAHFLIHFAPPVADGRNEYISRQQLAAAEAALAVAAVGIDRDGTALERDGDGFARLCVNHVLVNTAPKSKRFLRKDIFCDSGE